MLDQIKTLIAQVLDTDTTTKIDLINQLKLHLDQ